MDIAEGTLVTDGSKLAEHITVEKTRRSSLDGWSKAVIALSPALVGVVTYFLTKHGDAVAAAGNAVLAAPK